MNRVTRLAGALLLESAGQYFLVGDLKRPCNFAATGFVPPPQPIDALANPCLQLAPAGALTLSGPWLALGNEPRAPRWLSNWPNAWSSPATPRSAIDCGA